MPTAVTFYILVNAIAVAPGAATDASFVAGYERFFNEDGAQQGSGGELLISELSCTACHTTHDTLLQPKRGPQLDSVGLRVQREWLLQYLASPQTVKPGTTMPNMLHGMPQNEIDRVAHALTAYLMSQRKPLPELVSSAGNPIAFEFWRKGNVDRGKVLYHQVGCVACHAPDSEYETDKNYNSDLESLLAQLEPDEIRELGLEHAAAPVPSVPHGNLPTKYTQRSLTFFLLDPNSTRPSGRMPSLKLKPEEAADIAAYLLRGQAASPSVEVSENSRLAEEGRRLFAELRCVNCHDIGDSEPVVFAKPLSNLDSDASRSCIGTQHAGLPAYSLTANQLKSVQSKLRLASASDTVVQTASENVYLRMLQLNCYACHERDKRGGVGPNRRDYFATVGHVDLGDEGRLPPPLDGIGEKLTASWFKRVFEGTGDIRPHLFVRMPVFESRVLRHYQLPSPRQTRKATLRSETSEALINQEA